VSFDEKDFSVITDDFVNQTVGIILIALNAFLFLVTIVASVVGGIGIMNTMFMGVLERVREIGILKAIGASERTILLIFLVESAVIGLAGGAIGLLCGWGVLILLGQFGIPYVITLELVLFVFSFSLGVGIAAGYLPARQAARMDPIEALRYE
jgi:putative ABC transport system permease protein